MALFVFAHLSLPSWSAGRTFHPAGIIVGVDASVTLSGLATCSALGKLVRVYAAIYKGDWCLTPIA